MPQPLRMVPARVSVGRHRYESTGSAALGYLGLGKEETKEEEEEGEGEEQGVGEAEETEKPHQTKPSEVTHVHVNRTFHCYLLPVAGASRSQAPVIHP